MFDTGKLAQVTSEMRAYKLHILGVSECRWTGFGEIKTREGETVLYSGRDDNRHQAGVAIILKKGVQKTLIEWKPVNERLMRARFKGRHGKLTVLQCYAPTNEAEEEEKEQFYSTLQREAEATPSHDILVIMGDLNAKVGAGNEGHDQAVGTHGCGTRNDNGERLVNFCTINNLVIGGTLFTHQNIHKLTWMSPNGRDQNQIDHIMISKRWRGSLLDVKARRGADVGSDHHLVIAKVRVKLRKAGSPPQQINRYNV
jgi:exonuclease III